MANINIDNPSGGVTSAAIKKHPTMTYRRLLISLSVLTIFNNTKSKVATGISKTMPNNKNNFKYRY